METSSDALLPKYHESCARTLSKILFPLVMKITPSHFDKDETMWRYTFALDVSDPDPLQSRVTSVKIDSCSSQAPFCQEEGCETLKGQSPLQLLSPGLPTTSAIFNVL